jgi:hypothetical protein
MRTASWLLLALCLTFASAPAMAQTLYENGPINGEVDAWTINFGFVVDDTFFISTPTAQVGGISFGAWVSPGDTLQSVEVSITSDIDGGTTYFDGIVNITQSGCFMNNFSFNVCTETGSFAPVTLNNGTFFLNLMNAVTAEGNPVYWDENSGVGCHSQGCPSVAYPDFFESIPSEAFTILGTAGTGTTPEPSSLVLFSSGVVGVGGMLRRKLRKSS